VRWIIASSLKFRRLVVAVGLGLMVYGLLQVDNARTDILPEFKQPTVEVQTEALGLSAEEVEQLITVPLEQDLLVGVAFLDEIESASIPGLSSVVMTFEPGTDLLDARQVVAERLTQAVAVGGLPAVAEPPQMLQPLSSTSRVAMVKVSSDSLSAMEMSVLARWVIVPRLLGVEGVANTVIWGFRDRQLQVLVDPQRLNDAGVTLDQVIRTAGNALEVSPLTFLEASSPGTGGFIDKLNQRLHIFHEQAISTPAELAQVPIEPEDDSVATGGEQPTIGDVAEVVEDHQPLIGDALCGDEPCLLLVVEKFPEANTPEVTAGVDEALDALSVGLPMRFDTSIYRPAAFIDESFDNLAVALLVGGILLVLVLGAFLFEWRSGIITLLSLFASLSAAWLVLYLTGTTVNVIVVAGLAMALVVLIDDAVVDVENVVRRLRHQRVVGSGTPAWRVVLEATLEGRRSILFATLVVAAVLIPMFFMEGAAGAFLPSVAVAYLLATAASFLVAVTFTPALGMMLLARAPLERRESPVARWTARTYERAVSRFVTTAAPATIVLVGVAVVGLLTLPFLDTSLRPDLRERDLLVRLDAPPGTSLPRMDALAAQAVDGIGALPGVDNVGAHVGRAIQSDQVVNVNSSEVWVNLDETANYDETVEAIEGVAGDLPEVSSEVMTYSEQRMTNLLDRSTDEVIVRIYGENPEVLRDKAEEIQQMVAGIDGVEDSRVDAPPEQDTIEVQTDPERAREAGLLPGDVRRSATTLLSGLVVGNLFEEQKVFDVVVWSAPELRRDVEDVEGMLIDTPDGRLVPLADVADVRVVPAPTVIRHESVQSYLDVTATVSGRDVGDAAADIDAALERVEFPSEHHAEILGGFEDAAAGRTRTLSVTLAAAVIVFLLLQAAFSSWRLALLAFVILPASLTGGAVAVLAVGDDVTLGSIAGFVAVLAFAVRCAVLLIRHLQQLERDGLPFGRELVVRGAGDRVVATIISAIASIAVFLPFALRAGEGGLEIVGAMGVVILGGMVTATVLTLLVIPALYVRFGFVEEPDTAAEELFREPVTVTDEIGG
jgi:Cu/Ag efflux pump CusA